MTRRRERTILATLFAYIALMIIATFLGYTLAGDPGALMAILAWGILVALTLGM